MKPQNIAFVTTFDSYEEAEEHWNKIKHKEEYGIGVAGGKHFIIKVAAIDAVFEEPKTKPLSDEEIWQKGFAEGKSSGINQFIRDECDRQLSDEEILEVCLDGGYVDCIADVDLEIDGLEELKHQYLRLCRAILKKASEK